MPSPQTGMKSWEDLLEARLVGFDYEAARKDFLKDYGATKQQTPFKICSYDQGTHDANIYAFVALSAQVSVLSGIVQDLHELVVGQASTLKSAGMRYRGVHRAGERYSPGDFITHGGGLFHCEEATELGPKDRPSAWKLAVKRGRDARNRP